MSRQLPNSVLGATQPNLRELTTFRSFTRHFIPGGIAAFLIFDFFLLIDIFEYPFATAGGGIEWIAAALMPLFSFVSLGSLFGALCWLSRISEAQTRERAWQRRKTLRNSVFPSEPETDFERADDLPPPPFDSRLRRYKDHISNEKSAANSSDFYDAVTRQWLKSRG
jgi:hypothetical protein